MSRRPLLIAGVHYKSLAAPQYAPGKPPSFAERLQALPPLTLFPPETSCARTSPSPAPANLGTRRPPAGTKQLALFDSLPTRVDAASQVGATRATPARRGKTCARVLGLGTEGLPGRSPCGDARRRPRTWRSREPCGRPGWRQGPGAGFSPVNT